MSTVGATATTAAFVEEDIFTSIWTLIVEIRGELLMFAVAMVGYFVLFMMRPTTNPKLQTKKVEDDKEETRPTNAASKTMAKTNFSRKPSGGRSPCNSQPTTDIAKQINMIRSHAADKNLPGACSVFESMEQSGIELNCIMYNTVLDACVECQDLQAADAWMERMVKAGMTDVVSFNTLIKASLQNGSFDKARRLMRRMTSEGLQPNQVTFNELMNAMVSKRGDGRCKEMWALVDEMKVADVKPNQVTISILLKCLNYHSSQSEVAKTFELIKTMDEVMDEVLLSSVVEACVRIGKPALLEAQLKNLQDSTPIAITGSHTYGSLIKAYGYAKDLNSIWRCWKEMRSRHIKPTSITMGCMVEAIVNNGDSEGAYDLIHQMQEDDQCRDALNSIVYCSVLKGFTREKKIDRVWAVYQEMKDTCKDAELSIVTYNTLIDACARCGRMEHLPAILEDMKTLGAQPNVITYSTMLKGHCQNGDVQAGFAILDKLRNDPLLKADEITYNSLLDGCAQNNLVEEGLRLLEEMQAEHVYPSNYTLSILVKLMSRARRLEQAFSLVEDITKKYNFWPNVHVYTNLVQACIFNQQLQRGLSVLEEMVAGQIAPDGRTYAILLRACLSKNMPDQAAGLLAGALCVPGALPFLQKPIAACPSLDHALVNDVLGNLADRGRAKDLAVPLLQNIKQNNPKVRIDAVTQRKVMAPCVGNDGSSTRHPWNKTR